MYSIGQVAEMFGLPISTLRYYDKQGLFPNMERVSGIRKFGDTEIEALRVIECLKKAGMEIKDIRQFMDWCAEGPSTYPQRKAMFEERKAHMEAEIAHMNRALDMLKFKCWYYEQAIQDGSEDRLKALIPDHLPEGIQKAYENAHSLSVCNRLLFPPSFVCPLAGLPTVRFGFFSALCSLIEAKKYPVGFPTRHQRRFV